MCLSNEWVIEGVSLYELQNKLSSQNKITGSFIYLATWGFKKMVSTGSLALGINPGLKKFPNRFPSLTSTGFHFECLRRDFQKLY